MPSSRTPEGFPSRCPVCGATKDLEFGSLVDDAPCPQCGSLLSKSMQLKQHLRNLAQPFEATEAEAFGSLHILVAIEEELGIIIPDQTNEEFQSVGDMARWVLNRLGENHD